MPIPGVSPHATVAMLLGAARALGMLAVPWWPGSVAVPLPVRGGTAAALGALLGPVSRTGDLSWAASDAGALVTTLALNLLVGLAVGYGLVLIFSVAEMGGHLVELVTGMAPQALLGLPAGGPGAGPLGTLATLVLLLVFLSSGGLEQWVVTLVRSTDMVPLAGPLPWPGTVNGLVRLVGRVLDSSLGLAAPALGAVLLVNLAIALSGRLTGQAALYFAALPAQALAVLAVLLVTAGAAVAHDLQLVHLVPQVVRDVVGAL